jgi:glycerophosphoryl diester phosphodiesterase
MLVYELKCHSCPEVEETAVLLTIEKLKESGLLDPSRVMFISFSKYICERLSQLIPDFDVQYLNGDLKPLEVKKSGIPGIDYHYNVFYTNKKWMRNARKRGMSTNVWTVNKKEDMRTILMMKPDMLTTDNPLEAREVMKEMGIQEL